MEEAQRLAKAAFGSTPSGAGAAGPGGTGSIGRGAGIMKGTTKQDRGEARVRAVWEKVQRRIPAEAMAILRAADGKLPNLTFYFDPEAWETATYECSEDEGSEDEGSEVRVNLDKAGKANKDDLTFTLAHELAHAFLGQIGAWSTMHVTEGGSQVDPKLLIALEALSAFSGHEASPPFIERSADAIAISWGFGREAGVALRGRKRARADYLDRELIAFARAYHKPSQPARVRRRPSERGNR